MYILSLFSSSFIEEEHQIWYFLEITQLYLMILLGNNFKSNKNLNSMVILLLITRFTRMINQTGNKWVHVKDVGDTLRELDSKVPLVICGGVSLFIVGCIEKNNFRKTEKFKKILLVFHLIFIYFYHISTNFELFSL
jgi:hypothetical protein